MRPCTDTRESMKLCSVTNIGGLHLPDVTFVDSARRNVARFNKITKPLRRVGLKLVVRLRACHLLTHDAP